MSADGSIELKWADGDYRFRLPLKQLRELQDKCKAGPFEVFGRLHARTWFIDDVRETIRLGLIGGGLAAVPALVLVERYVDACPLYQSAVLAQAILGAAVLGVEGDQPDQGKGEAVRSPATTDGSSSQSSTEPALH